MKLGIFLSLMIVCRMCVGNASTSAEEAALNDTNILIEEEAVCAKTDENICFSKEERFAELSRRVFENKNVVRNETILCDTIIGNFHISYIIVDNDDIVKTQFYEYADQSVFLWLKHNDGQTIVSDTEINKYTFASIIPKNEINQYQIVYFRIKKVEEDKVIFDLNICVPDTDWCYPIELSISKNGDILMSEREQIWEE